MAKKIKDSDILKAMAMHLDEDSVVFGANGHYAVGVLVHPPCSVAERECPRGFT